LTLPMQNDSSIKHPVYGTSMHRERGGQEMPADLLALVELWHALDTDTRKKLLTLAKTRAKRGSR